MANKVVVIGFASLLLVAMVVAVAVGVNRSKSTGASDGGQVSTSSKAVQQICQPTDYKETCEQAIGSAAGNATDPKALVQAAFDVSVKHIREAMKNSTLLQDAAKDPRTKDALENCQELLDFSIDDLKRSVDKVGGFDLSKMDDYIADLKTWLSGAITYQQTCLEGFENTTGDTGEKMKKFLKLSGELTSNGLAIVTQLSQILGFLPSGGNTSRRLLTSEVDGFPEWLSQGRRSLLAATPATLKPNVVVAKDGSGKYKTVSEALKEVPLKGKEPFVIYVKAGVYVENVNITKKMTNVYLIGDGKTKTKITGSRSYVGGYNTYKTATVCVDGMHFMAKNIGFENSAGGDMHQAVALRVSSDRSIIYNCQIDGYQDTLYAHAHRQFYRDSIISGTVDFIFGDAAAVFQNCKLVVRKPLEDQSCMVTAQGRTDRRSATGIVLQNCTITGEPAYMAVKAEYQSYLGRPWKMYSRTVVMQSRIDDIIAPSGWAPWAGTVNIDTVWYAEFGNRGAGAAKTKRVKWKGIQKLDAAGAEAFTAGKFIGGDTWIPVTGVPYSSGMMKV